MWYLRSFGGLSIETDGRPAASATRRRPLALLAVLAVAGERGLSRDKVVALLWPESDDEHGHNSLSQVLASLRRDIAADDPFIGATELRLNPSVITSDVGQFERYISSGALDRAVALYQGPFLDGFFVRQAAEFERWVEEQRRRLHDMCATALQCLARAADERSKHEVALVWWRRLSGLEPTSAQAVSGLMSVLVAVGDRAGARRQYRVHEELMRQEFGAVPDPAVSALADRLFTEGAVIAAPIASTNGRAEEDATQHGLVQRDVTIPGPDRPVALSKVPDDNRLPSARQLAHELDAIATPIHEPPAATSGDFRGRSLSRRAAIVGLLLAVPPLTAVGITIARWNRGTASSAAHRVVVRTFKNNTGDPALGPISVMAADWIARGLAETPSIDVAGSESDIAARDSTSKTSTLNPIALARLVHARYVISGSYTTQRDSLLAQAEIWDADAGTVKVSVPAVGDAMKNKLVVLERLRQRVTDALVPFFDSSIVTLSRVPPRYEAYEEFLTGNQLYESDHAASIEHLRAAARLDSSFMYARIRLISAFEIIGEAAARDSVIADVAAKRNLLSPYEAAAFAFRDAIAHRDSYRAYLASATARRLAPRSTWAAFEGGEVALLDGRPHEAVRLLEGLDPGSGALRSTHAYYTDLCRAYHDLDRSRDLRRCYDRSRRQYPKIVMPSVMAALGDARGFERMADSLLLMGGANFDSVQAIAGLYELDAHGHSNDARAIARRLLFHARRPLDDSLAANAMLNTRVGLLGYLGEWRELAELVDSTPAQHRSHYALSLRGMASAMLGDTADARRHAEASTPGDSLLNLRDRARILAALGDRRGAFAILRTFAHPAFWWQYHGDVFFRLMRDYQPFQQFLRSRD